MPFFHIPFCLDVGKSPYRSMVWAKYFADFACVFWLSSVHNVSFLIRVIYCNVGGAVTGQEKQIVFGSPVFFCNCVKLKTCL